MSPLNFNEKLKKLSIQIFNRNNLLTNKLVNNKLSHNDEYNQLIEEVEKLKDTLNLKNKEFLTYQQEYEQYIKELKILLMYQSYLALIF